MGNENFFGATDSTEATMVDLDIAVNTAGMDDWIAQLKIDLLENIKDKLRQTSEIVRTINAGWQGEARDNFFTDFNYRINEVVNDITSEYDDLINRLQELENNYLTQDNSMYGQIG